MSNLKDDFWSEALVRTGATGGHIVCSFTPLKGATALIDELRALPDVEGAPEDKYGVKYKQGEGWAYVRATWDDQTHISKEDQAVLKKGFAAYELEARVYGLPVAGHGRIYPHTVGEITYNPQEKQIDPKLATHNRY